MKKLISLILLTTLILISCTKENPIECKQVLQYGDHYEKGVKMYTWLVKDFGIQCGDSLTRWRNYRQRQETCDGDSIYFVFK